MRTGLFEKLEPTMAEWVDFFGAFLRQPARVGAVAPSSPVLAQAMLHGCDLKNAKTVVEFGPGTGAFTRAILERVPKTTTFFALELDCDHVRRLRERFPGLNVHQDCAETIQKYLAQYRRQKADYVISGLPWSNMKSMDQDRILDTVVQSLCHRGMFTTFTYVHAFWLPRGRRFRARLEKHFPHVSISPVVWQNMPPALVYRCRLKK